MLDFACVFDRIKKIKSLKTKTALAECLGLTRQSLYHYEERNALPFEEIVKFCIRENISLDYILLGRGEPAPSDPPDDLAERVAQLEKMLKRK